MSQSGGGHNPKTFPAFHIKSSNFNPIFRDVRLKWLLSIYIYVIDI